MYVSYVSYECLIQLYLNCLLKAFYLGIQTLRLATVGLEEQEIHSAKVKYDKWPWPAARRST